MRFRLLQYGGAALLTRQEQTCPPLSLLRVPVTLACTSPISGRNPPSAPKHGVSNQGDFNQGEETLLPNGFRVPNLEAGISLDVVSEE